MLVDGKSILDNLPGWQKNIGYIPQSIFIADDTILNNVSFGIDDTNFENVISACKLAQIHHFIMGLPENYNTVIGEDGMLISGGQRQRIGIARALYNNPEILVMDEGTSSLDHKTEKSLISAINNLKGKKTIIMIAHRINTIKNCDYIFEISEGRVANSGTIKELDLKN